MILRRFFRTRWGANRAFYRAIDSLFGFVPHNIELYKLALIHKSASVETPRGLSGGRAHSTTPINNERLEFLGDAIIEAITSDYLFIRFPEAQEGALTQLRSKIVSRRTHNLLAERLGLDAYIISTQQGRSVQKDMFGDAYEAMIGAIYLDMGYEFVNRLVLNIIFPRLLDLENILIEETDFKSRLIEWSQKTHHSLAFETTECGSSRSPQFQTVVLIDRLRVGVGRADTKKESEQRAAQSVAQAKITDEWVSEALDRMDLAAADVLPDEESVPPVSAEGTDASVRRRRRGNRGGRNRKKPATNQAESVDSAIAAEETAIESVVMPVKAAAETVTDPALVPAAIQTEQPSENPETKPAPKRRGRPRKMAVEGETAPAVQKPAAKKPVAKKPATKKPAAVKKTAANENEGERKTTAKKPATAKKTAPKRATTAKKPAAKKTLETTDNQS